MNNPTNCHNCGGEEFTVRTVEVETRIGKHKVVDGSVRRPVCDKCGEYTLPAKTLEKVELRAGIVALSDIEHATGAMIRFSRKALGMTQVEFADALGTSSESVSRWERDERPMEKWFPVAVKGLLLERLNPAPDHVEMRRVG